MQKNGDNKDEQLKQVKGSLAIRLTVAAVVICVIFALISVAVSVTIYKNNAINQTASDNNMIAKGLAHALSLEVDCTACADKVVDVYKSMSKEELDDQSQPAYRDKFKELEESREFKYLENALKGFKGNGDIRDIYIFTYDEETENCIYIADPDDSDTKCLVGEYEYVTPENFAGYYNSTVDDPYDTIYMSNGKKVMTTGTRIEGQGNHKCVLLLDIAINSIDERAQRIALFYMMAMIIVAIIIAFVVGIIIRKFLVKPINKISQASVEYIKDKQDYIQDRKLRMIKKDKNIKVTKVGEHFSKLNIHTGDEIENLANSLKLMESDLKQYDRDLKKITSEKERISAELNLATKIQEDMLPNLFPAYPDREEFDIFAKMTPAKEVGGDFYDFFLIDEDHLGLVMADVSGKGIPAALFMMNAKNLIENYAMLGFSPSKTLSYVNKRICENNDADLFVTVWFGILEISSGIITAANAGHDYPAVMHEGGTFALDENVHGMVVGLFDTAKFTDYEIKLEKGSKIFLYTDGVPEATRGDKKMYGLERMVSTLAANKYQSPENLIKTIREDVDDFVEDADQFDDITTLCLEYKGK